MSSCIVLVDEQDADLLEHKWFLHHGKRVVGLRDKALSRIIMARVIGGGLEANEYVDNINLDSLCNVRANLRIVSHALNMRNRNKQPLTSSKYKGVTKDHTRWKAMLIVDKK